MLFALGVHGAEAGWLQDFPPVLARRLGWVGAAGVAALLRVRVASGKFWSDIAEQRLCAFGGRVLVAAITVRTV